MRSNHEVRFIFQKEDAVVRKNASSSALQERNLVSKFLYRTLQDSLEAEDKSEEEKSEVSSLSLESLPLPLPSPSLPDPQLEPGPTFSAEKFVRNYLWTFEDIRMLIGSNMPIFGDSEHPCVSLRLRDMKKPINILTGLDYWLDNLMCQVPEVVMCYHLDGIVQRYELLKTEELPSIDGSNFSPKIVKNIAQNILAFLKSNAAKEGHTYWLFKAKDDDIVKLYDLTSLSQKDSGIDANHFKRDATSHSSCEDSPPPSEENKTENPFQTPVSMLLYRLARNILECGERCEEEGTVRELLTNCVALLDSQKYPHIATSAHFLLSELYLPDCTDPAKTAFSESEEEEEEGEEDEREEREEREERDPGCDEEYSEYNVDVSSLCVAGSLSMPSPGKSERIRAGAEQRCNTALRHIDQGLQYLSSLEERNRRIAAELEKERARVERENIKMSVPHKPIPMGYVAGGRTRSVSEGAVEKMRQDKKELTVTEYLKYLLLKKALLVYVTLAELYFNKKKYGRTLKCVKRAMNCHSMVVCLGGGGGGDAHWRSLVSLALSLAGDSYMGCVYNWDNLISHHEEYNAALTAEAGIAREIEKYTTELDRDWIIKQPRDISEALELSSRCYSRALEGVEGGDLGLTRKLANTENELGSFYMNQAKALVEQSQQTEVSRTAVAGALDLLSLSRKYLQQAVVKFRLISDPANTALLLSNTGRLHRLLAHLASLQSESGEFGPEEISEYKAAVDCYQRALTVLGSPRLSPASWDNVQWELCSTLYTMGTLYQDQPPLSLHTREELEKLVTEMMGLALKYCTDQTRAAIIHHRLASLYHHSYRHLLQDTDTSNARELARDRNNKMKLADFHYVKATNTYSSLNMVAQTIRTVLERAGLVEASLVTLKSEVGRYKANLQVLDIITDTKTPLDKIISREEKLPDQTEVEDEEKMVATILSRLQATLLALIKGGGGGGGKQKKSKQDSTDTGVIKNMYGQALKVSVKTENFVAELIKLISKIEEEREYL